MQSKIPNSSATTTCKVKQSYSNVWMLYPISDLIIRLNYLSSHCVQMITSNYCCFLFYFCFFSHHILYQNHAINFSFKVKSMPAKRIILRAAAKIPIILHFNFSSFVWFSRVLPNALKLWQMNRICKVKQFKPILIQIYMRGRVPFSKSYPSAKQATLQVYWGSIRPQVPT